MRGRRASGNPVGLLKFGSARTEVSSTMRIVAGEEGSGSSEEEVAERTNSVVMGGVGGMAAW